MSQNGKINEIAPSRIIAGLGNADREALSTYLALYEDAEVPKLLLDTAKDWVKKGVGLFDRKSDSKIEISPAFQGRIKNTSARILSSSAKDDELRIRLWIHMREAFELSPKLTRSRRGIPDICNDLAASVVGMYQPPDKDSRSIWERFHDKEYWKKFGDKEYWKKQWEDLQEYFKRGKPPQSFADVVRSIMLQLLRRQVSADSSLDDSDKQKLLDKMRDYIKSQGEGTVDSLLDQVGEKELSDEALQKILASSGLAIGAAAAINMAGFSAYILAAQASAIIPLVGGKTLVSIVAVLADPIFVGSVIVGSVVFAGGHASNNIRKAMTVAVSSLLTLQGLENVRSGEEKMLASLGSLPDMGGPEGDTEAKIYNAIKKYKSAFHRIDGLRKDLQLRTETKLSEIMERPALPEAKGDAIKMLLFPKVEKATDTAILSALTVGDLVYHSAMIKPEVLAAMDFSYGEDIDNISAFSYLADEILKRTGRSLTGTVERLKGYVAEQVVADRLIEQGHLVSFPTSASQKGYDLIVDGEPVQVKCFSDLSGLAEHFEENGYEYPVIANSELAEKIAESSEEWAVNVYFIEGYDEAFVQDMTQQSLESGTELLDQDVPFFAASVATARNLHGWWMGDLTGDEAAWQIILQGSVKISLGLMGGFAGKYAGLLIFGPAGAVIGNAVTPVLLLSRSRSIAEDVGCQVNRAMPKYRKWEQSANRASEDLLRACIKGLDVKMNILDEKYESVGNAPLGDYVRTRMQEDRLFLEEMRSEIRYQLTKLNLTGEKAIAEALALAWRSRVHPVVIQEQLRKVLDLSKSKPTVIDIVKSRRKAEEIFKGMKNKYKDI